MISLAADQDRLIKDWLSVASSGSYAEGIFAQRTEEAMSTRSSMSAAVLNSCGSGLFAIARLLKRGEDRLTAIIPNNSFFATGAMFREAGWDIVLADCALDDFCLTPATIMKAAKTANSEIGAVVLTHVGGMALRYAAVSRLCADHGWCLVEDAAHVLGVRSNGLQPGDLGCAAVYSMYPTKAVPAGEGGIVVSRDTTLIKEVKRFRSYGKETDQTGVIRYNAGFNLRMDEWNAVVALAQIELTDKILQERAECARQLMQVVPPLTTWQGGTNWYKFPAAYDFPATRKTGKIYERSDQGACALGLGGSFPVSEKLADMHICLPIGCGLYAGMSADEIANYLTVGLVK